MYLTWLSLISSNLPNLVFAVNCIKISLMAGPHSGGMFNLLPYFGVGLIESFVLIWSFAACGLL